MVETLGAAKATGVRRRGCPLCGGPVERDDKDGVMFCPADDCPWEVRASGLPARYSRAFYESGLPACPLGHRASWAVRRIGSRVDLLCQQVTGERTVCGSRLSIGGSGHGFCRPGAHKTAYFGTEKVVMAALSNAKDGGLLLAELVQSSGLGRGQCEGCLHRLERTGRVVSDRSSGFPLYQISPKGWVWVRWAIAAGLYEQGKDGSQR